MRTTAAPQTSPTVVTKPDVPHGGEPGHEKRCLRDFPEEGNTKRCSRCERFEECIRFTDNQKGPKALLRCACDLGSKFYEDKFTLCRGAGKIEAVIRWPDHREHCNSWDLSCVGHSQCRTHDFSADRCSLFHHYLPTWILSSSNRGVGMYNGDIEIKIPPLRVELAA